jgi:hypothetical protein
VVQTHTACIKKENRQFTRYMKKINLKSGKIFSSKKLSVMKIAETSEMLIYILVGQIVTLYSLVLTQSSRYFFHTLIVANVIKKNFFSFTEPKVHCCIHKNLQLHTPDISYTSSIQTTSSNPFFFTISILMSSFYLSLGLTRDLFHFKMYNLKNHHML